MMETSHQLPDLGQARANLRAALSRKPESIEIRRVMFETFMDMAIGGDNPIGHLIDEVLTNNITKKESEVGPSVLLTRTLRYMSYALLAGEYPGFPEDFTTFEAWWDGLDFIYDDDFLSGPFEAYVKHRNLPSNVPDRYKGLKLALQLCEFAGRIDLNDGSCTIVDVGCSGQHGNKMILGEYVFGYPECIPNGLTDISLPHMQAVAVLLDKKINIGRIIGIDMFEPDDDIQLLRACSLEPDELADPNQQRVKLFNDLERDNPSNLHFFRGDFAEFDRDRSKFEHKFPGVRPQVVHCSMALYEDVPKNQYAILDRAKALATEIVVVTDHLYVKNGKIYIRDNWRDDDYPCRTTIIDVRHGGKAHEIAKWSNSRLTRLAPVLGRIATNDGGYVTLETMIDHKVHELGLIAADHIDIRASSPRSFV